MSPAPSSRYGTTTPGPPKRSHWSKDKDKVNGSQLRAGLQNLKELAMVRSIKESNNKTIRLQAHTKLAQEFPNLMVSEKIAIWSLFENEVKAETYVGIGDDKEGAIEWLKTELRKVGIENPLADLLWSDSEW